MDLLFGCSLLMQAATVLSERIAQYCALFPTHDETKLKQELLDAGYIVTGEKPQFSPEAIATMQRDLEQKILPWLQNAIGYRGMAEPLKYPDRASEG